MQTKRGLLLFMSCKKTMACIKGNESNATRRTKESGKKKGKGKGYFALTIEKGEAEVGWGGVGGNMRCMFSILL